jgi:hypothetical protein
MYSISYVASLPPFGVWLPACVMDGDGRWIGRTKMEEL